MLRVRFHGSVVCEPQHQSWFSPAAEQLLHTFQVARVAADPARVPAAAVPGGRPGLVYYRWHGTPEMYVSAYTSTTVEALAAQVAAAARTVPTWCIFDNTARGAATTNALELLARQAVAPATPSPAGYGERGEETATSGEQWAMSPQSPRWLPGGEGCSKRR